MDAGAGASERLLHGGGAAVLEAGGRLWLRWESGTVRDSTRAGRARGGRREEVLFDDLRFGDLGKFPKDRLHLMFNLRLTGPVVKC